MSDRPSQRSLQSVFDQIEDALGATAHGRAFLHECGRRARSEETSLLLDAVARLERGTQVKDQDLDRQELGLLVSQVEMALREARLAFGHATGGPAGRLRRAEPSNATKFGREATSAIAGFAEVIQETSWRMRETGFDASLCDTLEEQTTAIHAACKYQDRMLDGLGTIERAIGRADAFVDDLKQALAPNVPTSPLPPMDVSETLTLSDGDIEFVIARDKPSPQND